MGIFYAGMGAGQAAVIMGDTAKAKVCGPEGKAERRRNGEGKVCLMFPPKKVASVTSVVGRCESWVLGVFCLLCSWHKFCIHLSMKFCIHLSSWRNLLIYCNVFVMYYTLFFFLNLEPCFSYDMFILWLYHMSPNILLFKPKYWGGSVSKSGGPKKVA